MAFLSSEENDSGQASALIALVSMLLVLNLSGSEATLHRFHLEEPDEQHALV
jgi:hypothetical protein